MRTAYHEALESTRLDVVRLGALAGDAIRIAVEALEKRDSAAGARVVAGDDTIDDLRRKIEAWEMLVYPAPAPIPNVSRFQNE